MKNSTLLDGLPRKTMTYAGAGLGAILVATELFRRTRRPSFAGKTALITGGSRGLGLVLARRLAREGANLAICSRDLKELEAGRNQILEGGGNRVLALPCDITDRQQVQRMVSQVTRHFGHLDLLINNAGTIEVGPLEEMRLADFEEAMDTHFWAPLYTILAATPHLKQQRGARIINIVSVGGKVAVPHLLPYCTSKFALAGLSEGLRAELAKDGITVTTIFPGLMRTGSPGNATFKGRHREEYTWFSLGASTPLLSMSAETAARRILNASRRGAGEVILGLPATLIAKFHALFPGLTLRALESANRLLPAPGGIGARRARGHHSGSRLSPSPLTVLSDRAAERNNETTATQEPEQPAA